MAMGLVSASDLMHALFGVTSDADARAMVSRATRVSGVADDRPLELRELLMMCDALCAEGGSIQQVAEEIAMRALRES